MAAFRVNNNNVWQIRVEAYDQGLPTPLSSDLDLTIYVRNINDFRPQFKQDIFSVNFTGNLLTHGY